MAKYSIAVTGGIGSGKSFASDIIKSLGYQTFSCDEIAKNMYDDENLKSAVIKLFGEKILDSNGNIFKKTLADIVFSDKAALKKLNDLTHPYIVKTLFDNIKKASGVVVSEVPVLFESDFDEVFIIKRDLKSRIDSVVKRSAMTEEAVTARINSQFDYETGLPALIKESEARLKSGLFSPVYTIIYNNGDSSSLRASLISALSKVKEKLKQR